MTTTRSLAGRTGEHDPPPQAGGSAIRPPLPVTVPSHRPLVVIRRVAAATLAGLTLLLAIRLWFVTGLLRPITIDGPSMAPALVGRHLRLVCGDCGFPFACDAEHLPADGLAACPNCGYTENRLAQARPAPADRVLIDRWPVLWRGPQRGTVVAFAAPAAGSLAVKRVAAVSGQQLAIREGDVYGDAQIVRKSLAELAAVRILVHDQRYQPRKTAGLPPRWRPARDDSRWRGDGFGFRCDSLAAAGDEIDWLEYEHWPCTANPRKRGIASPITDNDSFNQGETRRALNVVPDVLLTCRLRLEDAGQLVLAAVDGAQRFELAIEPRKRVVLRRAGQTLVERPLAMRFSRGFSEIAFGLCDRQVLLAINQRTLIRHPYDRPPKVREEVLHPLAIGSRGPGAAVRELRIWRDIYYLDPQGLPRAWQASAPLAAREIAVLGDNQPVSVDSRHFDPPGVPLGRVLGRVERLFGPARFPASNE